MRRVLILAGGFGFGFGIAAATIAALVLFGIGVGGHYLVVRDSSVAKVISFDPSTVAARAPYPAALALILTIFFIVVWIKLGQKERLAGRSNEG
jgi:hypothetical protein